MTNLSILPGKDRVGKAECFDEIRLERGNLYSIVGSTGSGKSRLIKDIEQLVDGDSITGRRILLDGQPVGKERRNRLSNSLIAHLGQNMKFVLDISIEQFIGQHASARGLPTHVRDSLHVCGAVMQQLGTPHTRAGLASHLLRHHRAGEDSPHTCGTRSRSGSSPQQTESRRNRFSRSCNSAP